MISFKDAIPEKNPKELKRFWLETAAYLSGFAVLGLVIPFVRHGAVREWPAYVLAAAVVVTLCGLGLPSPALRVLYRGYMVPFVLIGMVMSRVVLGILFFIVVTPIALMRRLVNKDPLQQAFDAKAASYRKPSDKRPPQSMEVPF